MKKMLLEMYLQKNLGDDLFLYTIANRYKNITFNVFASRNNINNLNLTNVRRLGFFNKIARRLKGRALKENKKYLAKIILGGSMFIEQSKTKQQLYDMLNMRYIKNDTPLFILGSNFGPYKNQFYYDEYKKVFKKAKDVCFREKHSKSLFKDLTNIRIAPDIVFGLNTEKYKNVLQKKKVVISVINLENRNGLKEKLNEYENMILNIANHYTNQNYEVVLMSFCKDEGDDAAIDRILKRTNSEKIKPYYYNGDIDEALEKIASSEIVVGTRFHSIVLGLVFNKKILPIIYSDKTKNMLNDLKFNGKMLEIDNTNKINDKDVDSYISNRLNVDKQRKMAEEHFEKLDKFVKENM